jgi:RimJ/RimL family protein N-acetyltransferase
MELVRLQSGREVLIRPIRPDDATRLQIAYERLSPESRYRRFLALKPYLTQSEVRYLVDIDGRSHVALIARSPDDAGHILAVGRYVAVPDDPHAAEFAIVVADHIQGEGLGTELLDRLAGAAVRNGFTRFRATMFADNEPAHRLVRRLAQRQPRSRNVGPLDEFEIDLAA